MANLVECATSDLLGGPDWALNLEICDAINQNPSCSRDVIKALKKRLSNKTAKVQILSLTVLEMIMKNCGDPVHQMVAEKDVLHDLVKIVKRKGDPGVRDKILMLLESWQKTFSGPNSKYQQFSAAYNGLQRAGVKFPIHVVGDTILFMGPTATQPIRVAATETTLAALHTTRSLPELAYGLPAGLNEVLAASENFVWSERDLDSAQQSLDLLNEMLNVLDPKDKQAVHNDLIVQLVEQCQTNQKIVRQLVNSSSNENLLGQALSLNDDIQQVLAKHDEILLRSSGQTEETAPFPTGLVVYDHEETQTDDEPSQLAHKSNAKGSRSSAFGLESVQYSSSHRNLTSTSGSLQSSSEFDEVSMAETMGSVRPDKVAPSSDAHSSMINPSANMAPISPSSTFNSRSNTANVQTHLASELASLWSACDDESALQQTHEFDQAQSLKSPSHRKGCANLLPQRLDAYNGDVINLFSNLPPSSPAPQKKSFGSLPPPPILHTERERFFEEQRQMNWSPGPSVLAPSCMEQRLRDPNLVDTSQDKMALHIFSPSVSKLYAKKTSVEEAARSHDRLFADLVDLKATRSK